MGWRSGWKDQGIPEKMNYLTCVILSNFIIYWNVRSSWLHWAKPRIVKKRTPLKKYPNSFQHHYFARTIFEIWEIAQISWIWGEKVRPNVVKWHLRLDALPSTLCQTNGESSEISSGLDGPPSIMKRNQTRKEGLSHEFALLLLCTINAKGMLPSLGTYKPNHCTNCPGVRSFASKYPSILVLEKIGPVHVMSFGIWFIVGWFLILDGIHTWKCNPFCFFFFLDAIQLILLNLIHPHCW